MLQRGAHGKQVAGPRLVADWRGTGDVVLDYNCQLADHRSIFYLWRPFLPDPRDDLVLELAVEAGADYIVTHNLRDFAEAEQFGVRPIAPGAFLRRLRGEP